MKFWIMNHETGELSVTEDINEWGRSFHDRNRLLLKTKVRSAEEISTVFLGMDNGFGSDGPLLFETMVFGGPLDQTCERYATCGEAIDGHLQMVMRVIMK